jgi:hypothetical protein
MKVSEFLEVAKDTKLFYINKVGSPINVNNDYSDRNDLEFGEFANNEIEEVTFILEMEKSCQYMIDIIPVIFIKEVINE